MMDKKENGLKKGKKRKSRNQRERMGKLCLLVVSVGMLMVLPACGTKEAVLLEENELVLLPGLSGGTETAGQAGFPGGMETAGRAGLPGGTEAAAGTEAAVGMGMAAGTPEGETGDARDGKQAGSSTLFVHICGEVMEPGVYELPVGSRVFEAVEAAGGFTGDASRSYVNLAQELADGWKVEIPALGREAECGNGPAMPVQGENDGLVDINTATEQELCTLPGVGESRAQSIISYREKNGGFERIEDIMKVEGIKDGMFSKMKDMICVR